MITRFLSDYPNPGTRRQYRQALASLAWYVYIDYEIIDLTILTPDQARAWVQEGMAGLSLSTIRVRLSAARMFYRWAVETGQATTNPFARIRQPPGSRESRGRMLEAWEAQALLDATAKTEKPQRNRALLLVALYCGPRRAELAALTWRDWGQQGQDSFLILRGKRNKERLVKVPAVAVQALGDLRRVMGEPAATVRVFGLTGSGVYQVVVRLVELAGIESVSPHDLRRTFITWALDGKAPLERVQEAAGHASPVTTEVYDMRRRALRDAPVDYIKVRLV